MGTVCLSVGLCLPGAEPRIIRAAVTEGHSRFRTSGGEAVTSRRVFRAVERKFTLFRLMRAFPATVRQAAQPQRGVPHSRVMDLGLPNRELEWNNSRQAGST
jgi:hypothetical protein